MFYINVKWLLYITMCACLPNIICSMEEHLCKILDQIHFACWLAKLLFEPTTSSGILWTSCDYCELSLFAWHVTALVYMTWWSVIGFWSAWLVWVYSAYIQSIKEACCLKLIVKRKMSTLSSISYASYFSCYCCEVFWTIWQGIHTLSLHYFCAA